MIFDVIRNGFSISTVISLMARVFVVFCVLPVHEFAHAWVAHKLGDDTAKNQGRLTLNPLAHLNIIGAVMIFLVGFGYANPVPVNARNFGNPKKGMALTAAAGPISNLLMALFFAILTQIAGIWNSNSTVTVAYVAYLFFWYAGYINVSLAVFNLIPIPPLDGSRLLTVVLPSKYYFKIMKYERYIILAVFALLLFGILDTPLAFLSKWIYTAITWVAHLPFSFIS